MVFRMKPGTFAIYSILQLHRPVPLVTLPPYVEAGKLRANDAGPIPAPTVPLLLRATPELKVIATKSPLAPYFSMA